MKLFNSISRLLSDVKNYFFEEGIPTVYFTQKKNVGDLLNVYIIKKRFNVNIYKSQTNKLKHLRLVGSVLGSSSRQSYIFGGGSIDGKIPSSKLDVKKVKAVRGHKTLDVVRAATGQPSLELPLGDPAVLLPYFYEGKRNEIKFEIGVIPHFDDKKFPPLNQLKGSDKVLFIDVESDVEDFIDKLLQCKYIISSSLHGLIISDTYKVPNKRVVFGEKILGGDFKFEDYYSTTSNKAASAILIRNDSDINSVIRDIDNICSVKEFREDKKALLETIDQIPTVFNVWFFKWGLSEKTY